MFVFGVFVDSPEVFERHCLPGIAAHGGADATLITSGDLPVAATYNQMLDAAGDLGDVEAVVILRQDVTLADPGFREKVRAAFASDDTLSVLLPADTRGGADPLAAADGACLVLHPRLLTRVRFDEALTGTHGHALDLCRRVRDAGERVSVASIAVAPHADAATASARSAAVVSQGQHARRVGREVLTRVLARHDDPAGRPAGPAAGAARRASEAFIAFDHPELIAHLPSDAHRVLDLGCGAGTLGAAIASGTGAHVVGVTDQPAQANLARTRLADVALAHLDETTTLPFDRGSFDVVVAAGLLERLADPAHALELAAAYLRPGGRIVATVPNVKHWSVVLPLLVQDRWEYTDTGLLARSSLRFFTMVEAAAMFRAAGFGGFEVCAANQIPLGDPAQLEPLRACLQAYGVDGEEAGTLLDSYGYLVVAALLD